MRIAEVAPLYESVPPKFYGGTERVAAYLTEALVELGHDVTLFASGDSITSAKFQPQSPCALRLDDACFDRLAPHVLMAEKVCNQADQFDIIHNHIDHLMLPVSRRIKTPVVTTMHGRLDFQELPALFTEFSEARLISISDNQRKPLLNANWQATIYHGLPKDLLKFNDKPEEYLAFLGRICPEKRVDHAIEIAKRVGMKLKIAAKIDTVDQEYFDTEIKHLFDDPIVEYIGEIGETEKQEFLGNAYALLFPIDWPEPFGLVMIESMACGTPIIANAHGSVPEVMVDGESGFVVNGVDEAVAAFDKLPNLSRKGCREVFERRFTSHIMAENYLKIFKELTTSS